MIQEFTKEEAKLFLERITPNKDCLYIFQPAGLADTLCAGGLSYAAREKRGKNSTVLIVQDDTKNFGVNYADVKFSYLSSEIILAIKKYLDEEKDNLKADNFIYGCLDTVKPENFTVAEGLNVMDYYRKLFDIPKDTPCRPPIVNPISAEDIDYWNQRYTFDKKRTIILSAFLNKQNFFEIKFWTDLVQVLTEKNYIVYTYIENFRETTIPNTRPLFANFNELSYIAENVKCFISARTGISFFLAMNTNANILFMNKFPAWIWDVKQIFPNSNTRVFYNVADFINPILAATLNEDGAILHLEVAHPKVPSEETFQNYEETFINLLDAVEKL